VGGDELGDMTPSQCLVNLYVHEFEAIKALARRRGVTLRVTFAAAYAQMDKRRRTWGDEHPNHVYPWHAAPQIGGDNVLLVSVWLLAYEDSLRDWQGIDGVDMNDVAYTAIVFYLSE
jgi:hypothetical protein